VTIAAPGGYHVAGTLQAPLASAGSARVHYAATLAQDQTLDVSFQS
jgi:hypothetical protein